MKNTTALPHILIVGDQANMVQLLTELVNAGGYESEAVASGDEALSVATSHRSAIALVDLAPSTCDSSSLLRALHAVDPDLSVILISRRGSLEEVRSAMLGGAFDFYTEPFDKQELLASIAAALANRQVPGDRLEVSRV